MWLSCWAASHKVKRSLVWFPVRAHAWVVSSVLCRGTYESQWISVSLSHERDVSLPLSSCLPHPSQKKKKKRISPVSQTPAILAIFQILNICQLALVFQNSKKKKIGHHFRWTLCLIPHLKTRLVLLRVQKEARLHVLSKEYAYTSFVRFSQKKTPNKTKPKLCACVCVCLPAFWQNCIQQNTLKSSCCGVSSGNNCF